jgi:hypothetical protein
MKRLDLVQLTIIIVGIISGYFALLLLPQFVTFLLVWFKDGLKGDFYMTALIQLIIMLATYLIISIYTIKNSKQLAKSISNKASLQADINFALNKKELLFALLVGLSIYGLIQNVPQLIIELYNYIKGGDKLETSLSSLYLPGKKDLIELGFTVGLYFILLYYANVFAEFLAAKIKNTEPEDEINSHNES